ncbi:MAG TPA: hypothetical protein VF455_05140 [Chryseobacterium sp.]
MILIVLLIGCKEEKTFADDIVLSFPQDEKLTIQKFNEDANEAGTNLFYKGYDSGKVEIRYFQNIMPEPPPPPKIHENEKKLPDRINTFRDSLNNVQSLYFRNEEIKILETKDDLYDSLSNKNLLIIVREKDTIPLYKRDYGTDEIKKHKAFPVYIKNISTKILKIPIEAFGVALYISNDIQFQFIRNSNYTICGMGTNLNPYFELKPNEILIYSFAHLENGSKRKAKIVFFKAFSKEFEISIDEKIIKNQRSTHYLQ